MRPSPPLWLQPSSCPFPPPKQIRVAVGLIVDLIRCFIIPVYSSDISYIAHLLFLLIFSPSVLLLPLLASCGLLLVFLFLLKSWSTGSVGQVDQSTSSKIGNKNSLSTHLFLLFFLFLLVHCRLSHLFLFVLRIHGG